MAPRPPRAAASRHAVGTFASTQSRTAARTSPAVDVLVTRRWAACAMDCILYAIDAQLPHGRMGSMPPTDTSADPAGTASAAITDDGVARLRSRIGVGQRHPQPPHYRLPNEDAFRH